jgi:hypothetical protein
MSIAKITKDILGEKTEKRTKKINGEKITEGVLIILIIVTSLNLTYWLVPTFVSISFVLLQIRKVANNMKKR